MRFINRPQRLATRALLDLLCGRAVIDAYRVLGYQVGEYTHAAAAAFIASGMADVGFGIETPVREFISLEIERYFPARRLDALKFAQVQELLQIRMSHFNRHAVDRLPGYHGRRGGSVLTLAQALPTPGRKNNR